MTSEEQATDSFIFVQVNPQGSSRAGSVRSSRSIDGWSEISCPGSAKSTNSAVRKSSMDTPFSVFSGTYLQNASAEMPGMGPGSATGNSDKGYYLINGSGSHCSQENGPVFSSNSTTDDVMGKWPAHERSLPPTTMAMANHQDNNRPGGPLNGVARNNSNSIGSVGSRVPFSWAEITKIQPRFHHECASTHKPKVFDAPTKIATRHTAPRKSPSPSPGTSSSPKPPAVVVNSKEQREDDEEIPMPSIPESDPCATKADLGRRVRRSGKRGSRLKYPNGKRGSHRNKNVRRKKSQK